MPENVHRTIDVESQKVPIYIYLINIEYILDSVRTVLGTPCLSYVQHPFRSVRRFTETRLHTYWLCELCFCQGATLRLYSFVALVLTFDVWTQVSAANCADERRRKKTVEIDVVPRMAGKRHLNDSGPCAGHRRLVKAQHFLSSFGLPAIVPNTGGTIHAAGTSWSTYAPGCLRC